MADEAFELITYITTGDYDKEMTTEALCIPTDKANSGCTQRAPRSKTCLMQQQHTMTGQQAQESNNASDWYTLKTKRTLSSWKKKLDGSSDSTLQ